MQSSSEQRLVSASTPIPIKEIHVLWITAGLGCDGDTIAMTAATQPSIEDILLGGIPIPRAAALPRHLVNWRETAVTALFSSKRKSPYAIPCVALANFLASIHCISRTKASFWQLFPLSMRNPRCGRCARRLEERKRKRSAKFANSPHAPF
jgi:hypothetical protein